MTKFFAKTTTVLIACFIGAGNARASNIRTLATEANAVVVGSIDTRFETADKVEFNLTVDRVLKGQQLPSLLAIVHPWVRRGMGPYDAPSQIDMHVYGLWFLKKTASGGWDVLSASGPGGIFTCLYLPAVPQVSPANQNASSVAPEDQIALELTAALRANKATPETLLYSAGTVDSPVVQATAEDFLQNPDASVKAVGLAVLLTQSKPGAVDRLAQMWPSIHDNKDSHLLTWALRNFFRDVTPEAVIGLVQLANEPSASELRSSAMWALKAMHTKQSLPFLASLLSSDDSGEQMNAVIGLSSFANGCPPQTPSNVASMAYLHFSNPSPYRTPQTVDAFAFGPLSSEREQKLVEFWKSWWEANKATLSN